MFIFQNVTACLAFLDIPKEFLMNRFSVQWSNSGLIKISRVLAGGGFQVVSASHEWSLFPLQLILCTMQPWLFDPPWIIHSEMVKPTKSESFVPGHGCDYFSAGNSHPKHPGPSLKLANCSIWKSEMKVLVIILPACSKATLSHQMKND